MFQWLEQSDPKDAEGRKTFVFCVPPAAKLMTLTLFKTGYYAASCLGKLHRIAPMSLHEAQIEAERWMTLIIQHLYNELQKRSLQDGGKDADSYKLIPPNNRN